MKKRDQSGYEIILSIVHFFTVIFLLSDILLGSLVGAYFIGRQLPYFGPEVYYDVLTSAGTDIVCAPVFLRRIFL